jgi:hypothetical protein
MLASTDGKPVARAWLKAVAPDTVVMVAEGLTHAQVQWGNGELPQTPMPVLTMLGTNESGKVQVPCTSAPLNSTGVYYDDIVFEGRGGLRRRAIRNFDYVDGTSGHNPNARVVYKPLAEAKFDAYDLTGKLMPRSEALKRFAAGGMVLVAGDNRLPDETYLKGFHRDVIILVGSELVLPVVPVDQTRKKGAKDEKGDAAVQPAQGANTIILTK